MPSAARTASIASSSSSGSSRNGRQPVLDEQFLPRIVAIFYSIFHPTQGAKVVYQVPEEVISTSKVQPQQPLQQTLSPTSVSAAEEEDTPSSNTPQAAIFDFKNVSEFIIPKAALCGRLISYSVASVNGQTYKLLSHPVILLDQQKYPRKSFVFNLAFVFDGRADTRAYEPIVRKCARELRDLEISSSFLSKSESRMYVVIEQLFEDLNSYCESFVALPEAPHSKYVNEAVRSVFDNVKQANSVGGVASLSTSPFTSPNFNKGNGLAVGRESLRDALGLLQGLPPPILGTDDQILASAVRPSSRRASTEHPSMTEFQRGDSSNDSQLSSLRRPSADSTGRPSLGRSKTVAALAVNEATVTVGPGGARRGSAPTEDGKQGSEAGEGAQGDVAAMARKDSVESVSTVTGGSRQSAQAMIVDAETEKELQESTMSLRAVGILPTEQPDLGSSIGAVPPAAMLAPGKREPPHGLGRTVRDAINLKLFPTYPNPKDINDWDVPVTLLDLHKRVTGNWDLTMRKVLPFIDGINHVKRIAQLADADLELTRQCIEHLLYYRCIITMDTFQFANMYTVRPSIALMAEDDVIMLECASYVTRPGHELPTWPKLLKLYSSLRPATTVLQWMDEHGVEEMGIDARRFVSFGIIKGFLRRVHRYPVLLHDSTSPTYMSQYSGLDPSPPALRDQSNSRSRERVAAIRQEELSGDGTRSPQQPLSPEATMDSIASRSGRFRQVSENDSIRAGGTGTSGVSGTGSGGRRRLAEQPKRKTRATVVDVAKVALDAAEAAKEQERQTAAQQGRVSIRMPLPRGGSSSTIRAAGSNVTSRDPHEQQEFRSGRQVAAVPQIPSGFIDLLDGTHPDDEFCVRFGMSWREVLALLLQIGKQPSSHTPGRSRGVRASVDEGAAMGAASENADAGESAIAGISGFAGPNLPSGGMGGHRRSIGASLPKYRSQLNQSSISGHSGFNRYASTGDGASSGWGRINGSLGTEELPHIEEEAVAKGDLGRVKIILK